MKIDITTKNITLDAPLKVFVNEKMGALNKFLSGTDTVLRIEIGRPSRHHKKGEVFYAEANVKVGKSLFRGSTTHEDLRAAIVEVKEELHLQLKKFKDKNTEKVRRLRS